MSLVPQTRDARIAFYESKIALWTAAAASIGLTAEQVAALATAVEAARDSAAAQLLAQESAKTATQVARQADEVMSREGAAAVATIRAYAKSTNDPDVYNIAGIPEPAEPGPVAAPGVPYEFVTELLQGGALVLRWKCDNPAGASGTVYEVFRRPVGVGEAYAFVGTAGEREFADNTIPAGTAGVTYLVQAVRSTRRGKPAEFNVTFGGGGRPAETTELRVAA